TPRARSWERGPREARYRRIKKSTPAAEAPRIVKEAMPEATTTPTKVEAGKPRAGAAAARDSAGSPAGGSGTTGRSFLSRVTAGWTLFSAASAAGLAATARFLFPNDLFEPPTRFKVGKPSDYDASKDGSVDERWKEKYGIWVVRNLEGFYVVSTTCT